MTLLGEWREGKVRPIPGNAPHDRPVSRVISSSSESVCDDSLRATRFPQLQRTRRGPRRAFLRHGGIFHTDVVKIKIKIKTKPELGSTASRRSAPAQVEERDGRITSFSSFAMSSGRLFLDRVARQQSPSPLHRHVQHAPPRPIRARIFQQTAIFRKFPCLSQGVQSQGFKRQKAVTCYGFSL